MGKFNALILHLRFFYIIFKHWFLSFVKLFVSEPPPKDVSSEIILITGAASGLGKGMATRLARLGATLVLWDIDGENNTRLADELNQITNSKRIHAMKCDLSKKENIYECAQKVKDNIGDVTILINNAGVVSGKKLLNCNDTSIQRTFDVNVLAHFWTLKAFLPAMLDKNHGHIVNIASGAGLVGVSGLVDYCSSKFAAVGLHEALTHELRALGKSGVRTTVVCPSFTATGMFEGAGSNEMTPLCDPEYVCDQIVEGFRKNKYVLLIPKSMTISLVLNTFSSTESQLEAQEMLGLHQSMDTFVGRHQKSA